MSKVLVLSVVVGSLVLFNVNEVGAARNYAIRDIGAQSGVANSEAYGINDVGQVSGWANSPTEFQRAAVWDPTLGIQYLSAPVGGSSLAFDINNLGHAAGWYFFDPVSEPQPHRSARWLGLTQPLQELAADSQAFGINDAGQVVGQVYSVSCGGTNRAIRWDSPADFQFLPVSSDCGSWLRGINQSGKAVGLARPADGSFRAVAWDPVQGVEFLPSLPGDIWNEAVAINELGQIAGSAGGTPAIWLSSSEVRALDAGARIGTAFAINNRGEVVGCYEESSQAFIWDSVLGARLLPILAGATSSCARAINNNGQIAGYMWFSNGSGPPIKHAVIWEPVPDQEAQEFTINMTLFIPANFTIGPPQSFCGLGRQLYFLGDNRSFNPTATTFRGRQLVTVVPDQAQDLDGLRDGTSPLQLVNETRSYAPNAIVDGVIDASDDDGVLNDCNLLHQRRTASNQSMHVEVVRIGPHSVRAHMHGSLGNPLVGLAPPADWDFTITIDISGGNAAWTLQGRAPRFLAHDGFPAYEIYINGQPIYRYDPGPPPYTFAGHLIRLFPPLDVSVNTSGLLQ